MTIDLDLAVNPSRDGWHTDECISEDPGQHKTKEEIRKSCPFCIGLAEAKKLRHLHALGKLQVTP